VTIPRTRTATDLPIAGKRVYLPARFHQGGIVSLAPEIREEIVSTVRRFVEREVLPVASELEHRNEYPHALVERMKELGLFGATIPQEYGGLGLDVTTYAMVVEELCRGWMSLSGVLNTHLMLAYMLRMHGTPDQKQRYLPAMARGEHRGALCLTEPHAGSDVQRIRTTAVRRGDAYIVNGSKMFITNARYGTLYAIATKTDKNADPPYRGMSMFVGEKGPGLTVSRDLDKLGYKGLETCEVHFEDYAVPAANLIGGQEGQGFFHVMSGLEVGRINIAARAVGVARAAFEQAIKYAQQRETFGKPIAEHQAIQLKLADMATKIEASRLLTYQAADKKDRGERCDVEAGMAKLFASETCLEVSTEAMRILGGYGYTTEFPVERFYRDAPLMIIGEGTNEIQRLVIAKQLLQRYKI
jgi:alkylation response protein AidB-like acyl-CoA dehydrogenase